MSGRFVSAAPDCIRTRKAGIAIDRIVLHCAQGTLSGTVAWFATPGRSVPTATHYCIGRNGDIVQMASDEAKTLHAGDFNSRSIGVEHEAHIGTWPPRMVGGKVKAPPYPANEFPEAMLASSAKVVAILCRKFGIPCDRIHILGHSEVPNATHTDVGPNFPWSSYMDLVVAYRAGLDQ